MHDPVTDSTELGSSPDWFEELHWRLLTFVSGLASLMVVAGLGLFQWRLIWIGKHPLETGGFLIDWDPYPKLMASVLNCWIPVSLLICGVSIYLAKQRKSSRLLVVGWCLHAVSIIGLVSLGWWLFKVALIGEKNGVWWMW